jgi:small-conductance mechanosensitive channel
MATEQTKTYKPRLAGGNLITQAQKPPRSVISIPSTPYTYRTEDVEALQEQLAATQAQLLMSERQRMKIANDNSRLVERISELQSHLQKRQG